MPTSPASSARFYKTGFFILLFLSAALAYQLSTQPSLQQTESIESQSNEITPANEEQRTEMLTTHPWTPNPIPESQQPAKSKAKLLLHIAENKAITLRIEPLNRYSPTLKEGIADLFELSPTQVESINELLQTTEDSLLNRRMKKATTATLEDGSLRVEIPSFIDEGTAMLEQFNNSLLAILGPSTFDDFQSLAGEKVESALGHFGAEIATYDFSAHTNASGERIYKYKRTSKNGISTLTNSSTLLSLSGPTLQTNELRRVLRPKLVEHLETTPPIPLDSP